MYHPSLRRVIDPSLFPRFFFAIVNAPSIAGQAGRYRGKRG
jgi:hypothetical protein